MEDDASGSSFDAVKLLHSDSSIVEPAEDSGDVEAYITLPGLRRGKMFGGHDDIVENPGEQMTNYASATLDDIPEADASLRVERNEEDVLSDLESLLDE